ncbi:MAG: phosphatidylinositol-specific phospholipase C/glycerophosphodiester phosphodiesterase family protein [Pirellula sp.]|jgi:hypothetical protein|nr:phosphatidylinositol-specific phospholipase C/glycerophosphodiester phosphodiesterase family protein [Pirellula sp.]
MNRLRLLIRLFPFRKLTLSGAAVSSLLMAGEVKSQSTEVTPRQQAHAHNDYLHERPLLDALDQGFCSVEADIFLVNGELLVAHTRVELSPKRTLQSLYLDPLQERIAKNKGFVHAGVDSFTLLIDIKTNGEETYRALHRVLTKYADMLTRVDNGTVKKGPITAIVSGNRPVEAIQSESLRLVGIDGRLSDLDSDKESHLLPLISDNWTSHFQWRGKGEIDPKELSKLRSIVGKAHAKNRLVRFWASPDNESVWRLLRDEKVDLINTDNLAGLSTFLGSKP